MFKHRIFQFQQFVLLSFLVVIGSLHGVSSLGEGDFKGENTIIYAKTIEVSQRLYGHVISEKERVSETPNGEGVLVDFDLVGKAWDYTGRAAGDSVWALLERTEKPSEKEMAEAVKKDEEILQRIEEEVKKMEKRLGLVPRSDDEWIAYFYAGEAKMTVIESFKGELREGDTIKVTWKNVLKKRSCPHMMPYKGNGGWLLKGKVKAGGEAELLMGTVRGQNEIRELAKKVRAKKGAIE